jgi:hypothetical protein
MALMEDIEDTVREGDGLAQHAPPVHLVDQPGAIKDLLRYDLG